MLTRRRFIAISAAACASPLPARALHIETGVALGARVTLRLDHPRAASLSRAAMAEIRRLEAIFSLYQPDSDLVRLNRDGYLAAPAPELLDCLSLAHRVGIASGGRFDPTIQPLWQAEARAVETGRAVTDEERLRLQERVGWSGVTLDSTEIRLKPGAALTLNGIAQGYIADRVAAFLAAEGLDHALIDTGEMVALSPEGGDGWPVRLEGGGALALRNRALATSSPGGMLLGGPGGASHIFDPATGRPAQSHWRTISISASSAGLADALSTAACLMPDRAAIALMVAGFGDARLESASAA